MNSKQMWRLLFGCASLALLAILSSCRESSPDQPMIVPNPPTQPAPPRKNTPDFPTPIKLEKPRLLGPTIPAIVVLPDKFAEPMIRVRLTDESETPPTIKKGAYRGKVEAIQLADGKYVAINTLALDSYLQGVLAKELYGSWDVETFESQAIAARTYALFQILTDSRSKPWDVTNDEGSQMYGGIAGETAKSRRAVADTRGQVLLAKSGKYSGVFCAFYSACHGGATQDPFEAWGDPQIAPLSARTTGNFENISPLAHYTWPTIAVAKADITRCIHNWGQRNGFAYLASLGPIRTVTIAQRNPATRRPTQFTLTDTAGKTAPIRAEEFRLALVYDPSGVAPKPLSSWFEIQDAGDHINLVNGRGYGHGIGMSQWGAQALALQGKDHQQILTFYYPGATINQVW